MGRDLQAELLAAEIAARQHGVISGIQLRWAGISARTLSRWVERARIFLIGWGVYAYIPHVDDRGRMFAALLSSGAGRLLVDSPPPDGSTADLRRATGLDRSVVLSHWSALRLQRVTTGAALPVDVTIVGRRTRPRTAAVRGHQAIRLDPADTEIVQGLPTTSVARALIEVAPSAPGRRLRRLIREAQVLGAISPAGLSAACDRVPRHPGVAALRAVDPDLLVRLRGDSPLAGDLGVFLEHETALGPWGAQHPITVSGRSFVFDFARPDLRLAVEADGAGAHGGSQGRTADGRRDAVLLAEDWLTVRVTDARLRLERDDLRETLHAIAVRRGWLGPPRGSLAWSGTAAGRRA